MTGRFLTPDQMRVKSQKARAEVANRWFHGDITQAEDYRACLPDGDLATWEHVDTAMSFVAARIWDEGYASGMWAEQDIRNDMPGPLPRNPYRDHEEDA